MPTVGGLAAAAPAGTPDWVSAFLQGLGAPVNQNTVDATLAWQACEGGLSYNNPFNTTLGGSGATGDVNSVGVKTFGSLADGIAANIATINQSNMTDIRQALTSGGGPSELGAALSADPWGTNGGCVASWQAGGALSTFPNPALNGTVAAGTASTTTGGSGVDLDSSTSSSSSSGCVLSVPVVGCILTQAAADKAKGGLIMVAGGGVFAIGALVIVAYGLKSAGAASAVGTVASVLPAGRVLRMAVSGGR